MITVGGTLSLVLLFFWILLFFSLFLLVFG
jgi:hypothetical protein